MLKTSRVRADVFKTNLKLCSFTQFLCLFLIISLSYPENVDSQWHCVVTSFSVC